MTPSAFDAHHPPDPALVADCVHCGFCLPACPTYLLWGRETDSPRGRIALIKGALEGETGITDRFVRHFDTCLGCMACVTACPSGVQYDKLVEATRPQIERRVDRTLADRLFRQIIFGLFPYPGRLRLAAGKLWAYQRLGLQRLVRASGVLSLLPARLRAMEAVLPPVSLRRVWSSPPAVVPATGERRRRVGLLLGCVQRVFFDEVNAATIRVLAAEGCEVVIPRSQGCCGAVDAAQRPGDGRSTDGTPLHRRVRDRSGRGRHHRDQFRRLRLDAEGLRPSAQGRPGLCGAGAYAGRQVQGHLGAAGRAGAPGTAAPRTTPDRLPRRLPPAARSGRERRAQTSAGDDPGAGAVRGPRSRYLLRLGWRLQPRRAGTPPATSGTGRPGTS